MLLRSLIRANKMLRQLQQFKNKAEAQGLIEAIVIGNRSYNKIRLSNFFWIKQENKELIQLLS